MPERCTLTYEASLRERLCRIARSLTADGRRGSRRELPYRDGLSTPLRGPDHFLGRDAPRRGTNTGGPLHPRREAPIGGDHVRDGHLGHQCRDSGRFAGRGRGRSSSGRCRAQGENPRRGANGSRRCRCRDPVGRHAHRDLCRGEQRPSSVQAQDVPGGSPDRGHTVCTSGQGGRFTCRLRYRRYRPCSVRLCGAALSGREGRRGR